MPDRLSPEARAAMTGKTYGPGGAAEDQGVPSFGAGGTAAWSVDGSSLDHYTDAEIFAEYHRRMLRLYGG